MKINFTGQHRAIIKAKDTKSGHVYKSATGSFYIRFDHCSMVNDALEKDEYLNYVHFLNVGREGDMRIDYLPGALCAHDEELTYVGELELQLVQ